MPEAKATSESQSQPGASSVSYEGASKRYGNSDALAVDDLTLEVPAGEICVLVGPSGCGKTTAMRMVKEAGAEAVKVVFLSSVTLPSKAWVEVVVKVSVLIALVPVT